MRQELYRGRLAALSAVAPLFATRSPAHPLFCHSTMNRFGSLILARFTGDSTAPNSSRWRGAASTSAGVAARKPVPSSTSTTNSRGRYRSRASDAQTSLRNRAIADPARPFCRSAPPEYPQPEKPWTGTASLIHTFRSTTPVGCVAGGRAPRRRDIERVVHRVHELRVLVAFGQLEQLPQDTAHDQMQRHRFTLGTRGASNGSRHCVPRLSMSTRASTSAPQSGHLAGNGSRTSMANCVRQPRHSPATVSRRAGFTAERCAPSSRLPLTSPPPRAQRTR